MLMWMSFESCKSIQNNRMICAGFVGVFTEISFPCFGAGLALEQAEYVAGDGFHRCLV